MTTSRGSRDNVSPIQQSNALLPDELLEASHRMAANRARSARTLSRTRAQRRILPTIVVTSVALVGAGLANAFVGSSVVHSTRAPVSAVSAATSSQSAANARVLSQLAAVLAADQRTLAALAASAAKTRAAASASSSLAVTTSSGAGAGPVSVAASPVVAAPAPAPAPVTHATTGASSAG